MLYLVIDEFQAKILSCMKRSTRIGKAYFNQSIELISISREIVVIQRSELLLADLKEVLEAVDTLFDCASKGKTSNTKVAEAIESSKRKLNRYVMEHNILIGTEGNITVRMGKAKELDDRAMNRKSILDEKARKAEKNGRKIVPTEVYVYNGQRFDAPEIHILKKELTLNMSLDAVLFTLVESKRTALQLNPYFYHHKVPSSVEPEGLKLLKFTDSIEHVVGLPCLQNRTILHVVHDRVCRIFLESGYGKRVFGNIWECEGKIFLKDIRGPLLAADDIQDEYHVEETSEIHVISHGVRLRSEKQPWKEVLKKAITAKHDLQAILPQQRVDSGYYSPVSPSPPVNPFFGLGEHTTPQMHEAYPFPSAQPFVTQFPGMSSAVAPHPCPTEGAIPSDQHGHASTRPPLQPLPAPPPPPAHPLNSYTYQESHTGYYNAARVAQLPDPIPGGHQVVESRGSLGMSRHAESIGGRSQMQTTVGGAVLDDGPLPKQTSAASRQMGGGKEAAPVKNQGPNPQHQSWEAHNRRPVQPQTDARQPTSYSGERDERSVGNPARGTEVVPEIPRPAHSKPEQSPPRNSPPEQRSGQPSSPPVSDILDSPSAPSVSKVHGHEKHGSTRYGPDQHEATNGRQSTSKPPSSRSNAQNIGAYRAAENSGTATPELDSATKFQQSKRSPDPEIGSAQPGHSNTHMPPKSHLDQTPPQIPPEATKKRKGWFTRVIEKVKDTVGL